MKFQFFFRNRAAQIALENLAFASRHAHLWTEETVAIPAGQFSTIERHVRHLQETIGVGCMVGRQRNSDARRNVKPCAIDIERFGESFGDAVGELARRLPLVGLARLNDGELVAAEPRQHIGFPQK